MSHVKTAVSIDESVYKEAERIAHKTHVSRSRLFETAVKEWVKKENKKLLIERINTAIKKDAPDAEDRHEKGVMKKYQYNLVRGEW